MKYLVILVCIGLIALALWLFAKNISNMAKGKCCEGCKGCAQRENCSSNDENKENK
ncbi:MAG: FeoB-associated Cys-rich membrane protein [Hydrogenoanaerobacterium sp.]